MADPYAWQDELYPATGVDHACECGFFSADQPCLVLAPRSVLLLVLVLLLG